MKPAFKIGQRARVLFTDCNGHQGAKWLQRKQAARDQHLRNCWYDATVQQVFAVNAVGEPRYLITNGYNVKAVDECKLSDYVDVPWLGHSWAVAGP